MSDNNRPSPPGQQDPPFEESATGIAADSTTIRNNTTDGQAAQSNIVSASTELPIDPDQWIFQSNKEALELELSNRGLPIEGAKAVLRERLLRHVRTSRGESNTVLETDNR